MSSSEYVRLQKYMADCGVASRRYAEKMIIGGVVRVNGKVVRELGTKIDPASDKVTVQGKLIHLPEKKIYLKLNKPAGYVSSCRKFGEEKTILDLVRDIPQRLFPIGRLDKESEGLMILTNDGELANKLTHPRFEHEKEYLVNLQLPISNNQLASLSSGIILDGQKTLPARVRRLGPAAFAIILREGKNRQVRKMVQAVGSRVIKLKRIRIGKVELGNLSPGDYVIIPASWQ